MSDTSPLGELCLHVVDCEHKTAPPDPAGQYVCPGTRDIKNGRLRLDTAKRVNRQTYEAWTARLVPQAGDLILAREAPVGEVAMVPDNDLVCLGQRTVLLRPNPERVAPRYLMYLLLTPQMQHAMLSRAEGSTVPHLNMRDIRALEVPIRHDADEQAAIAGILGALDDLVAVNQRSAWTAEQLAEALFTEWFRDYGPVEDRAAGRPTRHLPGNLVDLFPAALEASSVGPIPSGWTPTTLDDHVTLRKGTSYKSSELQPSDTALVSLKCVRRGGGFTAEGLKPYSGAFKPEQEVHSGDVVVAHTDLTQAADVVGKPAIIPDVEDFDRLVASLDVAVVRPKGQVPRSFLYFLLKSQDFQDHAYGYANGSTVLHLNKRAVPDYAFALPTPPVLDAFDALASPLLAQGSRVESENARLTSLRNELLAALFTGAAVEDLAQLAA